jgi:uncharacterized protein (DUF2249 family)
VKTEGSTVVLDVRPLPVWERHVRIFERFDRLAEGDALLVTTDHEARPLRTEFERAHAGTFSWEQRYLAPGHWEVAIRKLLDRGEASQTQQIFRRCATFRMLLEGTSDSLLARSRTIVVKRHQAVVEQGAIWPFVGIVGSGLIQAVLVTPDGRELAMYEIMPGELFGVVALVDGGSSPLRYVARSEAPTALLLRSGSVRDLMTIDATVASALGSLCAQRVRTIVERFSAHAAQSITARVAEALLAYAAPMRGLTEALLPLHDVRQVELAIAAGTGKGIVYRAIAELEESGALRRKGGKITHLDREKLVECSRELKY